MPPPPLPLPLPPPSPLPTSTEHSIQISTVLLSLLLAFMIVFVLFPYVNFILGISERRTTALAVAPPQQPLPLPSTVALKRLFEYGKGGKDGKNADCIFCLEEFKKGELCRMLMNCKHVFHTNCIDKWTVKNDYCPICRSSILARVIYCSSPDS